jgi:diacylglycerol kinase (ATP)
VGFEALKLKRLHGFPSYIVAALKTIFLYFRAPMMRIEYDGVELTQPALMVSVMNGRRLGGGFMMAPDGEIDDGWFDLTIVDQVSRPTMFALIYRVLQGSQADHPAVKSVPAKKISVSGQEGALPAHADGETLCETGQTLEMEIMVQALQVIVPGKFGPPDINS